MLYLKSLLLCMSFCSVAAYSQEYIVRFTGVELAENERIAAALITARAFQLQKVMHIPADWSFNSVPELGVKIEMGAVHGAGFLHSADALSNMLVLSKQRVGSESAKVSGTFYLYDSETEESREIQLEPQHIVLVACEFPVKC